MKCLGLFEIVKTIGCDVMRIVLLSGGSGKRLWPLSNDIRSKQFIKVFKNEDGTYASMVERVYAQVRQALGDVPITIATAESQVATIRHQLGDVVSMSVEPCRRDTFPAIALAAAYLADVEMASLNEMVAICPIDPYVETDYFAAIQRLAELVDERKVNLGLLGIEPTYPSEKYGYILPVSAEEVSIVKEFKEKPTEAKAREYISAGALWNGGVFAMRLGHIIERAKELLGTAKHEELLEKYSELPKISFDYAVVEREDNILALRYHGEWKDLGTWNTLTEAMDEAVIGEAILSDTCQDVQVINELDMPVLCMGLKDVVVAASAEGILVTDKAQSSYIKPYVEKIDQPIRFAETSWGSFRMLDVGADSLTMKVTLLAGNKMKYHSHRHRDEVWVVTRGEGHTVVDGMEQPVKAGDVITMQAGCRHTIMAEIELELIEVQLGKDISVQDKEVFVLAE